MRPFRLELNEEALGWNDGFKELRDGSISVAKLTRRRRMQGFGILRPEFPGACRSKLKDPKYIMFKGYVTMQTFRKCALFIAEPALRRILSSTLDMILY
jgi:hypothetical protein